MNVPAVGGQRGGRRSKDTLTLLPGPGCPTLLSLGKVSKSGCTRSREHPPPQNNLNVSCWQRRQRTQPRRVSCPRPRRGASARARSAAGAGHCRARRARSSRSWAYTLKTSLTLAFHSAKEPQNTSFGSRGAPPLHFFIPKFSAPFKI